jgi:hypothetical protein
MCELTENTCKIAKHVIAYNIFHFLLLCFVESTFKKKVRERK